MDRLIFWGSILCPAIISGGILVWLGHPWWALAAAVTSGGLGGLLWFAVVLSTCRITG